MARKQDRFAKSASAQVVVNGHVIRISSTKDRESLERSIANLDRKIADDDWRPYASKEEAIKRWNSLNGHLPAVLRAKGLI